jgi:hypothetical protein
LSAGWATGVTAGVINLSGGVGSTGTVPDVAPQA